MSLSSFCNKLFKNENPENLDIPMKFRFKNKNMEEKDLFEILLVIFMYGLMIKYFKDEEEINLDNVSLEQFNNIAKYLNVIGIQPKLKKFEKNEDINLNNYPEKLNEFYYKFESKKHCMKYLLQFDYYSKNIKCNKAYKF